MRPLLRFAIRLVVATVLLTGEGAARGQSPFPFNLGGEFSGDQFSEAGFSTDGYRPTNRLNVPLESPPSDQSYFDYDAYLSAQGAGVSQHFNDEVWTSQFLPEGLIYTAYLAGAKESRFSTKIVHLKDDGWIWDVTVGSRIGVYRYGTRGIRPDGFQIDIEGSAQPRLDIISNVDVRSVDFRGGVPLTFGYGRHRTKVAYYHLSSHLGDEFLLANPGFPRLNFARDAIVLGHSVFLTDALRVYGETSWAFFTDVSKEWEFQFGLDYAPLVLGPRGAPFFAINGHLREEVNYSGNLVVQLGWAWRGDHTSRLVRMGLQYYNGKSSQFSFFNDHEEQLGFGVWYDF